MKTRILLIVSAFLAPAVAGAVDIEIGTGITHYKTAHDGLWYQDAYPHTESLSDTALSLGISGEHNGIRYRAEYLSLGWLYNSAQWTSDATYYAGTQATASAYGMGRGSASGILLSASRSVNLFGVPFYAEAGPWIYIPKWKTSVFDINTGVHLCECETPAAWHVGPALGFGIRHGGIDVSIKYIGMPTTGTDTPPIFNHAYVLEARVYF